MGEIGVERLVTDARHHLLELAHDPALATVEEGETRLEVADRHRLGMEVAHARRSLAAQPLDLAEQHGAPARLVMADMLQEIGHGPDAGLAGAVQRDSRAGTL